LDSTRAFLLIDLSAAGTFTYQKPILQWVKQGFPAVTVLDLDQRSEPVLVTYACRLLEEAEQAVIYFIGEKEAGFATLTPLLEQIIRQRHKCLVLLQGQHPRLHRMLSARSDLRYFFSEEEEELRERVRELLEQ
jgi:nucleoside-triphosphatase THEP1